MKNKTLFNVARFFFTPIRVIKELIVRRVMANEIISKYANLLYDEKKVLYFGIPEHNNLGDIAQTYCTRKWIEGNYPDRVLIEAKTRVTFDCKFIKFIKNIVNEEDLIVFQSGYCTRHKNPDHLMHLHIAKVLPEAKIVILPQTVKLPNPTDIKQTKVIFEKCKRLRFIARDYKSYSYAEGFIGDEKLECYPDIVTTLIGRVRVNNDRKGVLLCIRNDDEKYYSDQDLLSLQKLLREVFSNVDVTDTDSSKSAEDVFLNLEEEILLKIEQFSKYECIITDRYHGTIFSLIANTPVVVLKTNDHKVTSAVEWFYGVFDKYSIQVADSLNQAFSMAEYISRNNVKVTNSDELYNKYYKSKLKHFVDTI